MAIPELTDRERRRAKKQRAARARLAAASIAPNVKVHTGPSETVMDGLVDGPASPKITELVRIRRELAARLRKAYGG